MFLLYISFLPNKTARTANIFYCEFKMTIKVYKEHEHWLLLSKGGVLAEQVASLLQGHRL